MRDSYRRGEKTSFGIIYMHTHAAIQELLRTSRFVLASYLHDLTDQELLVRPVPEAHHVAWQLGHLLSSECRMIQGVCPDSPMPVSEECISRHDKARASSDRPSDFYTKSEYLRLMNEQREVTLRVLDGLRMEALSQPAPEFMRSYAPHIGSVFLAIGTHELMHAGQIAVARRKLLKPVVI